MLLRCSTVLETRSKLDNLEDGEGEGGAPENPVACGKVALVDDASLAAGVLNK